MIVRTFMTCTSGFYFVAIQMGRDYVHNYATGHCIVTPSLSRVLQSSSILMTQNQFQLNFYNYRQFDVRLY